MKRFLKVVLCIIFTAVSLYRFAPFDIFAQSSGPVFNLEFDSMITNEKPYGINSEKLSLLVVQPDESVENKMLCVEKPTAAAGYLEIPAASSEANVIYQFDLLTAENTGSLTVTVKGSSGTLSNAFSIMSDGTLKLADGRMLKKLSAEKKYNIALAYSFKSHKYALYIDGKKASQDCVIQNYGSVAASSALRFSSAMGDVDTEYYLDNIRCYTGTELLPDSSFTHERFNPKASAVTVKSEANTVYKNIDFENSKIGGSPAGMTAVIGESDSKITVQADPENAENKVLMIKKGAKKGNAYVNATVTVDDNPEYICFGARFYCNNTNTQKNFTIKDVAGGFNTVLKFGSDGKLYLGSQAVMDYQSNKWYKIDLILDYKHLTFDGYIDGELITEKASFPNMKSTDPATLRIEFSGISPSGVLYVDNFRFYAGSKLKNDADFAAAASSGKGLITPENEVEKWLEGAAAVLFNQNCGYAENQKMSVTSGKIGDNGNIYLPARFIAEGLGGKVDYNSTNDTFAIKYGETEAVYKIGYDTAEINGKSIALNAVPIINNGTAMLPAEELADRIFNKKVNIDKVHGIAVLSDSALEDEQLLDIYNYLTYQRPSSEQILRDFENMNGVHPRILVTQNKFDEIRNNIGREAYITKWYNALIAQSESYITGNHSSYPGASVSLLNAARTSLARSQTLALAYQLSGDTRYAEWLARDYEIICGFPDWNSAKEFLGAAEMCNSIAIGYDWCYDYWTDEQKQMMERAMLEYGIEKGMPLYQSATGFTQAKHNWNPVCNGGLSVAALALLDVYPETASKMLEYAFLSLENGLSEFAPDGAWKESINYWDYAQRYFVYDIASLISTLGTDYGYLETNNIAQTGYYMEYTQGTKQGYFNFADGTRYIMNAEELFFYADKLDDANLSRLRLNSMELYNLKSGALDLLYYNPEKVADTVELPLDRMFRGRELASFRSSFGDPNALFAAIKGGSNRVNHSNLDAGTFVIDALGERWAEEIGPENYNVSGYWGIDSGTRWKYYRTNTQGQNVVALNPRAEWGQEVNCFAEIEEFESNDSGGFVKLNMASAYGSKVSQAYRGMKVFDNRSKVLVQDEFMIDIPSDFWWFMQTLAEVELSSDGKSAVLTRNNKRMYLSLQSSSKDACFTTTEAKSLDGTSFAAEGVNRNSGFTRLAVHIPNASGEVSVAVTFVPLTGNEKLNDVIQSGNGRIIPMQRWKLTEESTPCPDGIFIDGVPIEDFNQQKISYDVSLEFGSRELPEVTAVTSNEKYQIEVIQTEDISIPAEIKVTDKENTENIGYYTVQFSRAPYIGIPDGYNECRITGIKVSSTSNNGAQNAIDGNLSTSWNSNGRGEWAILDLGRVKEINTVTVATLIGINATYDEFEIFVSENGSDYKKVYCGTNTGTAMGYESFDIGEQKARYVKILCQGTDYGETNTYYEFRVFGK